MSNNSTQKYGAGIWHFATYVDRYATDGYGPPRTLIEMIDLAGQVRDLSVVDINYPWSSSISLEAVEEALTRNNLSVIGITPEIYTRRFAKGAFTNPDAGVRRRANELCNAAADVVRRFGASYVKLWPGQDGWDYPFQVDHKQLWKLSLDGVGELAGQNPDLKFVIEYKPREPRVHMSFDSMARTLIGIETIGLPNIGVLLDFGHALYGGESPADAAQLAIDHGRLFGMDVNDNLRKRCPDMDQAAAALIRDLKRRGLLDETLVVWGGEFGRTPVSESGSGRDHNPYGFTMFVAGGGFKGGIAYGSTDEFGFKAEQNRVSIHDLHATLLNQLGMDHTKLTYRYAGRDFRLTDVFGEVVKDILV